MPKIHSKKVIYSWKRSKLISIKFNRRRWSSLEIKLVFMVDNNLCETDDESRAIKEI